MQSTRLKWRHWAATLLVALAPAAQAQVLRGRVVGEGAPTPVPGALVMLSNAAGEVTRRTLTDPEGAFALRAPSAGAWIVEVRAIGFAPYKSASRTVGAGETVVVSPVLRRLTTRLATQRVETSSACRRATELDAVATEVWDDIWAALASAEVAREQRLVRAEVFLYNREVDVASGRVLAEQRGIASVLDERPFRTASAQELAQLGYWRQSATGNVDFYGLSAGTIIAPEFLNAHCFSLARDTTGTPRVGLAFRPISGRGADVRGTLWVDPETRELREMEFTYTGLQLRGPAAGGSLSFSRLASGLLVDDRWELQHPFESPRPPGAQRTGASTPDRRDTRAGTTVRLAGGFVLTDSARVRQFALVLGRVYHGDAAADATTVELLGGGQRTVTDSSGAFLLKDIVPGAFEMRMLRQGSDDEGGFVQHGRLDLAGGQVARVDLTVPDAGAIARELCPGWSEAAGTAPLFGVLRNATTGRPAPNYQVELQWTPRADSSGMARGRAGAARILSDWRGEFVACNVPSLGDVRFRTTSRDAEWSDPVPAGRRLRVIEIALDSVATGRPPGGAR